MTYDINLLNKAIILATQTHNIRTRKGDKRPYILHPLSVAKRIFDNGFDRPYLKAIVAVLHDLVEDEFKDNYEAGFKLIEDNFGAEVLALVKELTLDKAKYQLLGKDEYLLQELSHMSDDALDIKLCDRLDNVEEMDSMDESFQIYYTRHTKFIFDNLQRELSQKQQKLVDDIKKVINKYSAIHNLA